jgi:hypothetical protein
MQLIPGWALPGFAVLPIGDGLTMGVDDAIKAAQWLGVSYKYQKQNRYQCAQNQ